MIRKSSCSASSRLAGTVAAALLFLWLGAPAKAASAPDWLLAAKQVDLGQLGDGAAAVVVGEWTDFSVDSGGKFLSIERRALRVLNAKAADRYLQAEGYENTDQSVVSIQTWAIIPSGKVIESQKKDLITQSAWASFELFSTARVKILHIAGAEDGALVGYEIVRSGHLPLGGERFELEDEIPVRLGELHVSVPSGSVRWFINHPDRVEIVSQSATTALFRVANRPAIEREDDAPPFASLATEVFVNYDPKGTAAVGSWEDAGRWIHPLLSDAEKPAPEIATEVENLSAGQADLLAKLNALYTFVSRQVRYVAVEIGIGGFEPHAAAEVFRNRYGDCKDKATLLLTMLDHIGLRGYPALVGTRGDVEADPGAPTLATFDHMIVALPISADLEPAVKKFSSYDPATHILWIDATSEEDPLGQLPEMDQGVFALISYPDRGALQEIPESPSEANGVDYTATLRLSPDGSGEATVDAKYLGSWNSRRHAFYRNRAMEDLRKNFEARVANLANQAMLRSASYSGADDNSKQVAENFAFTGNFVTAAAGDSWFFRPLFLSGTSLPQLSPRPRNLPLDLGTPFHRKSEYRIELPAGMRVAAVPQPTSLHSQYGSVEVRYAAEGNALKVTEELSFDQGRIPPENYAAFRTFVNSALRAGQLQLRAVHAQ